MKMTLTALLLLLAPPAAEAYRHDARLSARLKREFEVSLRATATGRELYGRLAGAPGYKTMRVLARAGDPGSLAWYDAGENAVCLNSGAILEFFGAGKMPDAGVAEIMAGNREVRAELVKFAGPVFLHELVHAAQTYLYPEYRRDAGANPVEFEYEAYLAEHMHIHETLKASSETLRGFIRGTYSDIYTSDILGGYFMLSLDPETYRERIRRRYEGRAGGYTSMREAAERRRAGLAGSRIIAYASGELGGYAREEEALARLKKQKEAYAASLEDFYRRRWPVFSAEALLFVGSMALEEKNYPLALDCLAVAGVNAEKYGLEPAALKALKTRGALAVLEAAALLRDRGGEMDVETLSQHLKALERACAAGGRPFPGDLRPLLDETRPRAAAYYSGMAAGETDPARREYYRENLEYFTAPAASGAGTE